MNRTGSQRVQAVFERARDEGSRAVIPYITAGDPDLAETIALTQALERGGADLVEWGIPFSDPLADGATIQRAAQRSLQNGTTSRKVLQAVRDLRRAGCDIPLVLMVYVNVILRYGLREFAMDAREAGVDGVIVPDVPVEESDLLLEAWQSAGLAWIPLVAPTSTDDRIALTASRGQGFVYCVSVTGVTGARQSLSEQLPDFLARVRRRTDLPLAVGFGISTPDHARAVGRHADGIIVGSALIDHLEGAASPSERRERAQTFIQTMKEAVTFSA